MADYDVISSSGIECGFFPALWNETTQMPDREYGTDDMCKPYRRLVSDGVFPTNTGSESSDLKVISNNNGMEIKVRSGEGIFDHKWFKMIQDAVFTVPNNNDTSNQNTRIDTVLVQVNNATRYGRVIYRSGTPAASPVPPPINTVGSVSEYRLANITVYYGAVVIHNANISDRRGIDTPWVTGLITQLGTNELFTQWNDIMNSYMQDMQQRIDDFAAQLTSELDVHFNLQISDQAVEVSGIGVTSLEVPFTTFDADHDLMLVTVNNYLMTYGVDYHYERTSATTYNIIFHQPVENPTKIDFRLIKAVCVANADSVMAEILRVETALNNRTGDSGWQTLTVQNGTMDVTEPLKIRKVGSVVNIKGRVSQIISPGTVITTLPSGYYDTTQDTHILARYSGTTGVAQFIIFGATGNLAFEAASVTPTTAEHIDFCSTWLA